MSSATASVRLNQSWHNFTVFRTQRGGQARVEQQKRNRRYYGPETLPSVVIKGADQLPCCGPVPCEIPASCSYSVRMSSRCIIASFSLTNFLNYCSGELEVICQLCMSVRCCHNSRVSSTSRFSFCGLVFIEHNKDRPGERSSPSCAIFFASSVPCTFSCENSPRKCT